jgi:hypothetical protein
MFEIALRKWQQQITELTSFHTRTMFPIAMLVQVLTKIFYN